MSFNIFVHIVTYNSAEVIESCVSSLLSQEGYELGRNLTIEVTDNASEDNTLEKVEALSGVACYRNEFNMGFCAAHNQGASRFLASKAEIFLVLNPDTVVTPSAFLNFTRSFEPSLRVGAATGKLLRIDSGPRPVIDSTGIVFTKALRHFDRGEEELDNGQYDRSLEVAGGTGACLFLTREFICDVSFRAPYDEDLGNVYPELMSGREERVQLFDEAFFAYREDADLAWRARLLGWRYRYLPEVVIYHGRRVTSTRRHSLPALINLLGVRNRFLLQLNNLSLLIESRCLLEGFLMRNALVIIGTVLRERTSLPAFKHLWLLRRRALARRREIFQRRDLNYSSIIGVGA